MTPEQVKKAADRAERREGQPKTGRPTKYNEAIADQICELIANGKSLRQICADETMPHQGTIMRWVTQHEGFREQYTLARSHQAELMADEIVAIADGEPAGEDGTHGDVQRDKLRVDARKWVASRLLPKKYGDKVTNEHTGADGGAIQINISSDDDKL